jgi:hypothetical protein
MRSENVFTKWNESTREAVSEVGIVCISRLAGFFGSNIAETFPT